MAMKKELSEKENAIISKRLSDLIEKSGVAVYKVAEAVDISPSYLRMILRGETAPTYTVVLWLANFFCVSMDYICGRVDMENEYDFSEIRRHAYEDYIKSRNKCDCNTQKILGRSKRSENDMVCSTAPWPYNLVEDILGHECDFVITDDQVMGLNYVINLLSERESFILREHYMNDVSVSDIASTMWNCTVSYAYQVLHKALRKCGSSSMIRFFKEGIVAKKLNDDHRILVKTLEMENEKLELMIKETQGMVEKEQIRAEDCAKMPGMLIDILTLPIEELYFSPRLYHCLKRSGLDTVSEVLAFEKTDEVGLMSLRNFGRKTYMELRAKFLKFGYDISALRDDDDETPIIPCMPSEVRIDKLGLDRHMTVVLKTMGIGTLADMLRAEAIDGKLSKNTPLIGKGNLEIIRKKVLPYGYDIYKLKGDFSNA